MSMSEQPAVDRLVRLLHGVAFDRGLMTYEEVSSAIHIRNGKWLWDLLKSVQRKRDELGCDLSALVVNHRTRRPGKGWGHLAEWRSAVDECYRQHPLDRKSANARDQASLPSVSAGTSADSCERGQQEKTPVTMPGATQCASLPYDPGNAGDLLKHSWLVIVARWLATEPEGRLDYADSFAGDWDYPLVDPVRPRLECLRGTVFGQLAFQYWDQGRYPGSTALVSAVCKETGVDRSIWVGDRCQERVAQLVRDHQCVPLPCPEDGYAVLAHTEHHDLILIDPLRESMERSIGMIAKMVERSSSSSLLVFWLFDPTRSEQAGRYTRELQSSCTWASRGYVRGMIPCVPGTAVKGEARYQSEMLFLPRADLAQRAQKALLPLLADATRSVAWALGLAEESRLCFTSPGVLGPAGHMEGGG